MMNEPVVAAVDVSGSTRGVSNYFCEVNNILENLHSPLEVIVWSAAATNLLEIPLTDSNVRIERAGTEPECFVRMLGRKTEKFHLYVFTGGEISDCSVTTCKEMIREYDILSKLKSVKLFYLGREDDMNLKFTDLFYGVTQETFINSNKSVGKAFSQINLESVDLDFIMKDDTFKAAVLSELNSAILDKAILKKKVCSTLNRILKDLANKSKIEPFYRKQNVEDCLSYVKTLVLSKEKLEFQRKMSDILKLFDSNIDTYSLSVFKSIRAPDELEFEDNSLEFNDMTCDILYENCKTSCFPVRKCSENLFSESQKKIIQNPFNLLKSTELVDTISNLVEPYIIDYETYTKIENKNISPFTRNELQGVYVLHNENVNAKALIQYNNYTLSTLFRDKLPGNRPLWHIVFLYILAIKHKNFSEYKHRLFEEIKYLSDQFAYFVTLTPFHNPSLYEILSVCFWYIARISHLAYPNSKKNMLRSWDAAPEFLKFYNDVYGEEDLPEMPRWQLWRYLFLHKNEPWIIFNVLAHHLNHKRYESALCDTHNIVLFQGPFKGKRFLKEELDFVYKLDVPTILSLFEQIKSPNSSPYDDLQCIDSLSNNDEKVTCDSFEEKWRLENDTDSLDLISINIKTCHPYVICPSTGLYWKLGAGKSDQSKESYLTLFKKYCLKYRKFPESIDDLIVFLNFEILRKKRKPEIFHESIEEKMSKVLTIFQNVISTYTCEEYLKISKSQCAESIRLEYE